MLMYVNGHCKRNVNQFQFDIYLKFADSVLCVFGFVFTCFYLCPIDSIIQTNRLTTLILYDSVVRQLGGSLVVGLSSNPICVQVMELGQNSPIQIHIC